MVGESLRETIASLTDRVCFRQSCGMTTIEGPGASNRPGRLLWLSFLALLFACWWGGLSFYAIVVVPLATEQFGSTEQGFVTQQVTNWHNAILSAMAVCLLIEARQLTSRILAVVAILLAITTIALVADHHWLTGLMNMQNRTVPESFYAQHAIYLWLTAVEWGTGLLLPILYAWVVRKAAAPSSTTAPIYESR